MHYRIEQIIEYVDRHNEDYIFAIREYASPLGEYHNEAVVFSALISDIIGIIIEDMPFNPEIYYNESEVVATLQRLQNKSERIINILNKATLDFNNYVGGTNKES